MQNVALLGNGATVQVVVTGTRTGAKAFRVVRSERAVAKAEDVVKQGESSLRTFE